MKLVNVAVAALFVLPACGAASDPEPEQQAEIVQAEASPVDTLGAIEEAAQNAGEGFDFRAVFPAWYEPADPIRIIGPVHYVGTRGLGMFFIPTDDGHILIDGGLPESAPLIAASIRTLGYDPEDIAILLNTHAHFDHSGGLAELKALSGAELVASEGDRSALEGGFYLGSEDQTDLNAPPVKVDRLIEDGDTVSLGGVTLTAHITPGHTRGCTSWTLSVEEGGEMYDTLIFCSASVAANRLAGPPQYEGIVEDYQYTFEVTESWRPDVFLANHPEFYGHEDKAAQMAAGDQLAFVDREGFPAFRARMAAAFQTALAAQTE